ARTSWRSPASPSRSACWSTAPSSRSRTPTSGSRRGSRAGARGIFTRGARARPRGGGRSGFFSLLGIGVSFLPVFTLVDQEGRLFRPLALSKNLAMALAAVLAITLDPALRMLFTRMEPFTFRPRFLAALANTAAVGRYYP